MAQSGREDDRQMLERGEIRANLVTTPLARSLVFVK
jgi:hypothetical protein